MNVDRMDLLETFPERRYVALSEAEAAELGSGALSAWRMSSPDGVHIDGRDYVALLRDGARWKRLARAGIWIGQIAPHGGNDHRGRHGARADPRSRRVRILALSALVALALGLAAPAQAPRERHSTEAERAFRKAVGHELERLQGVNARLRAALGRGLPWELRRWLIVAGCESGVRPTANTGNGFYGALQFALGSWRAVGGRGLPSQASFIEQLYRAERLQRIQGWGAWPYCARGVR